MRSVLAKQSVGSPRLVADFYMEDSLKFEDFAATPRSLPVWLIARKDAFERLEADLWVGQRRRRADYE